MHMKRINNKIKYIGIKHAGLSNYSLIWIVYPFNEQLQFGHRFSFNWVASHAFKHAGWKIWKQYGVITTESPSKNPSKSIVQTGSPITCRLLWKGTGTIMLKSNLSFVILSGGGWFCCI